MKFSSFAALGLIQILPATAEYTWPSDSDYLEDLLYLQSGYIHEGFADGVSPCTFSSAGGGRQTAAEWIRTAYHDMSTHDVSTGLGGLDASLIFETDREENIGDAFNTTFGFTNDYYTIRSSTADLIALTVVMASKACGGPDIALRSGRIDATEAGPLGVPKPDQDLATHTSRFATAGFNTEDMITMVACGHTLGGVHGADFPEITANDTAENFEHFDSTFGTFDNAVVTEYLDNNTTNLLVVGQNETTNSDKRVFNADGNKTMNALADPATFRAKCADIFTRMIDTVPATVQLSDPIVPIEVKPHSIMLGLAPDNTLAFNGSIRIRTTHRDADGLSVTLAYRDRNNDSDDAYNISTTRPTWYLGQSQGFDETFTWFDFATTLPPNTSISAFDVLLHTNGTGTETHTNGGAGFPVSDAILFQPGMSCQPQTAVDAAGHWNLTITAAVRKEVSDKEVAFEWVHQRARQGSVVDALEVQRTVMKSTGAERDGYVFFRGTRTLDPEEWNTTFDLVVGEGEGEARVPFLGTSGLPTQCGKAE